MEHSRRNFLTKTGSAALSLSLLSLPDSLFGGTVKPTPSGKNIPTIQGSVAVKNLGFTLMHEHIFWGDTPAEKRPETIEYAITLLKDAARVGIDTIVDLSPTRDITLHQAIADKVPVHIIVATGAYQQHVVPKWILDMNEKQFKAHVIKEITEGIGSTTIKAGIIKVAARKSPMTDWEKMVFGVAAQVNKELGTPIGTHAVSGARLQFDHLVKNGANPDKLFFSHIEAEFGWGGMSVPQMGEHLVQIAKEGGHLLFNNFGYDFHTPWADLVYLIRNLCDKGYASKVMTSMDCFWLWKNGVIVTNMEEEQLQTKTKTYAYAVTDAIPAMLKAGFSAKEINTFFMQNPKAYFS